VYLDAIEPAAEAAGSPERRPEGRDAKPADQSAWDTAVEAAPWIIGTREPQEAVPPEELYERLHPFKELVAEDISREGAGEDEPCRS
jgi:hypothetical protein